MEKPLVKLYFVIVCALALTILFVPSIVMRTSGWVQSNVIRSKLLAYQCYAYAPTELDGQGKGKAIVVFDDGWETQFTKGYSILEEYGFRGCIAVIPSMVGSKGYMDYEQLAELYMHGWDLLNHTYNHANLTNMSPAKQAEQINRARDWLKKHGFNRGSDIVVYPQGACNDALTRMLEMEGYTAARSLRSLWVREVDGTLENVEICNVISSMPLDRVEESVDRAIRNRSTVIIILHKIEPMTNDAQTRVDENTLSGIVQYLDENKEQISVITLTELLSMVAEQ